jgi:hypothetical protein
LSRNEVFSFMLEFLCPNGHKIHCQEERAGQAAKCPRCGIRFRIPGLSQIMSGGEGGEEHLALPDNDDAGTPAAPATAENQHRPAKERQIEFLCPNGHLLHGPASLQGRPGQCPDCGSRFRIPVLEEEAAKTPAEEEIRLDGSGAGTPLEEPPHSLQIAAESELVELPTAQANADEVASAIDLPTESPAEGGAGGHPLAELFARLWMARSEEGRVEVHLTSGGIVLPEGFIHSLSQQQHAVLATKEHDDTYTLTVVPWEGVARVIVRGIKDPPGEVV